MSQKTEPGVAASPVLTGFPIVGIGASAGGLAAFEAFFSGMPDDVDPGMAFVLVQHLSPNHSSVLTELIQRVTRMPVVEVQDGMLVQINCVYIIAPGFDMAFLNGSLQLLVPVAAHGHRLPIDFFFASLAQDRHEQAIGIVLSGTGSDGTLGVQAIKAEGGMVMAQTPESSEFDGMPRSAIATGLIDFALLPKDMPPKLMAYVAHACAKPPPRQSTDAPLNADALKKIFIVLRAQTGHDFSQYKPNTIYRRIERRMAVHQVKTINDYVKYLQQTPAEIEALFRDLLIGVTLFFRDADAFAVLQAQVIPKLFEGKPAGAVVRAWSTGCSTGEEAYSIAILLQEQLEALKKNYKVQVFATDIDSRAIAVARAGVYPASIAENISPERLARFFTAEPDGSAYRIHKGIRDMLVFSEQNVIKDPPFSKLDLICCRNLMIYLDGGLQKKLISLFHYALNPGGMLFLGTSETVGEFNDLFVALDRKAKVYQRQEDAQAGQRAALIRFATPPADKPEVLPPLAGQPAVPAKITNEEPLSVLDTAVPAVAATNTKERVQILGLHVKINGQYSVVNLAVDPTTTLEAPVYLMVPHDTLTPEPQSRDANSHIAELYEELQTKEEHLHTANEALETSNEELKSSNEEMQSVNEELQSSNEELETSKEELQSINEELSTVNSELLTKVTDLSRANNDMNNLLAGTGIGTLFVDQELRILRFTPAVTQIINLIASDVGRPVGHIVYDLVGYDDLVADVRAVLKAVTAKEVDVLTTQGKHYTMRILPYRTQDNLIEGAVITFVDISETVRTREALKQANQLLRLAVVVRDAHDAITVQDLEGRIMAWNPGAVRMYGWSEAQALTMNVRDRIPQALQKEALARVRQLSEAQTLEPYLTQRLCQDGSILEVSLTSTALRNEMGYTYAIATTERAKETEPKRVPGASNGTF